jgi:hypothetical protein
MFFAHGTFCLTLSGKSVAASDAQLPGESRGLPLTKLKIIPAFLDFFFSNNLYVDTKRNLNKSLFV